MGGVGVTFARGDREDIVEFYNDGTAHALFADNKTEELDTRPVTTSVIGSLRNSGATQFHDQITSHLLQL